MPVTSTPHPIPPCGDATAGNMSGSTWDKELAKPELTDAQREKIYDRMESQLEQDSGDSPPALPHSWDAREPDPTPTVPSHRWRPTTQPPCGRAEEPAAKPSMETKYTVSTTMGTYQVAPMLHRIPPLLNHHYDKIEIEMDPTPLPQPPPVLGPSIPYRKTGHIIRGGLLWRVSKDGTQLLCSTPHNPSNHTSVHWPAHQHAPTLNLTETDRADVEELMHIVGDARQASKPWARQESAQHRTRLRHLNTWSTDRA